MSNEANAKMKWPPEVNERFSIHKQKSQGLVNRARRFASLRRIFGGDQYGRRKQTVAQRHAPQNEDGPPQVAIGRLTKQIPTDSDEDVKNDEELEQLFSDNTSIEEEEDETDEDEEDEEIIDVNEDKLLPSRRPPSHHLPLKQEHLSSKLLKRPEPKHLTPKKKELSFVGRTPKRSTLKITDGGFDDAKHSGYLHRQRAEDRQGFRKEEDQHHNNNRYFHQSEKNVWEPRKDEVKKGNNRIARHEERKLKESSNRYIPQDERKAREPTTSDRYKRSSRREAMVPISVPVPPTPPIPPLPPPRVESLRAYSGAETPKGFKFAKPPLRRLSYNLLVNENREEEGLEEHSLILPFVTSESQEFFDSVAHGNAIEVRQFLADHPYFDINVRNQQNNTALHIAIRHNHEDIIEFLMEQDKVYIADALLYAIKVADDSTVKTVLQKMEEIMPGQEYQPCPDSAEFPDDLTPLMLAAREGKMEIVDELLRRGHRMPDIHPPFHNCSVCRNDLKTYDRVKYSIMKLNLYKAVANPNYLFQTSGDPIQRAFELTRELQGAARMFPQFRPQYEELWKNLRIFCAEFIGCCSNAEEVRLILEQTAGCRDPGMLIFPRLQFAIDVLQKEFVAHAMTQAVLEEEWTGGELLWYTQSPVIKALCVIRRIFELPFIALLSICVPPNINFIRRMHYPFNKLISYFAAYLIFLILLFIQSSQDKQHQKRGPPNTGLEAIIAIFVIGHLWNSLSLCFTLGPRRFFSIMWNWYDCIMLTLFLLTFIFWIVAAIDIKKHNNVDLPRKYWNATDPTLVSEGLFAIAVIMAYFRLYLPLSLNYDLGPLQISIGKMTLDTFRFVFIFSLMILAWCAGLSHLYQYYDGMVQTDFASNTNTTQVSSFVSFKMTFKTFFWAIFGMSPMESADVVIENIPGDHEGTTIINKHGFTEGVGYFAFALFNFLAVVVVLNMLVACMANTFTKVLDNLSVEWVFGRTQETIKERRTGDEFSQLMEKLALRYLELKRNEENQEETNLKVEVEELKKLVHTLSYIIDAKSGAKHKSITLHRT